MPEARTSASLFDETYAEANRRFRMEAAKRGLGLEIHSNPRHGPAGEVLETLVVELGAADAPNAIVINSGVHGTEALAGAGVLAGLLADPIETPADTKLVLIHVLNPYGAAWSRYVNEDNVDLMKNLVYGDEVTPEDPLFLAFDEAVDLAQLRDAGARDRIFEARKQFLDQYGLQQLMASLKKGQSDRPKSICFNGRGATWSTRALSDILVRHAGHARNVLFIDLHTGVGSYGEAYVIVGGDAASEARVRALLGSDAHDSDLVTPKPTYLSQGELLPDAVFTAVTMEAGTVEFGDTFREAMWLEMHDHMYGDPLSPQAIENSRLFRSFYYPTAPQWREAWMANSRAMLRRLFAGLEQWAEATR